MSKCWPAMARASHRRRPITRPGRFLALTSAATLLDRPSTLRNSRFGRLGNGTGAMTGRALLNPQAAEHLIKLRWPPSDKQMQWLESIYERLHVEPA